MCTPNRSFLPEDHPYFAPPLTPRPAPATFKRFAFSVRRETLSEDECERAQALGIVIVDLPQTPNPIKEN